jgi:O-antigen/teichoic acid export membrane protein
MPALFNYGKEKIGTGIFVMLGTLVMAIALSADRLIVSSSFAIGEFATYAFGASLLGLLSLFVGSVSNVLFPHLSATSTETQQKSYSQAKPLLIVIWAGALTFFFPLSLIIRHYLPNYSDAIPILRVLLCSVGFVLVIQILHQNYYWICRKQQRYFVWSVASLVIMVALDILAIRLVGTLLSVAVATTIGLGFWYLLNERELQRDVGEAGLQIARDFVMVVAYIGSFLLVALLAGGTIGPMLLYLAIFGVMTWLVFRSEVRVVMQTIGIGTRGSA